MIAEPLGLVHEKKSDRGAKRDQTEVLVGCLVQGRNNDLVH